jgi:predicted N-acyltransferase
MYLFVARPEAVPISSSHIWWMDGSADMHAPSDGMLSGVMVFHCENQGFARHSVYVKSFESSLGGGHGNAV